MGNLSGMTADDVRAVNLLMEDLVRQYHCYMNLTTNGTKIDVSYRIRDNGPDTIVTTIEKEVSYENQQR